MQLQTNDCQIVDAVIRGLRRQGLPPNVDPQDLRQEALLALYQEESTDAPLRTEIAKHAIFDVLKAHHSRAQIYTFRTTVNTTAVNGDGRTYQVEQTTVDPFFVLDVDGLKIRQRQWERERRGRWAGVRNGGGAFK